MALIRYRLAWLMIGAATLAACTTELDPDVSEASAESIIRANEKIAFDFFVAKGLTPAQSAGIIGNLDVESFMDPTINQGGGGPGRGIAQWSTGGRWDHDAGDNVVAYAAQQGASASSLNLQLKFVWFELTTFSRFGLAALRAATTVAQAEIPFEAKFEGCGACNRALRRSLGEDALARYGTPPPPPPPTWTSIVSADLDGDGNDEIGLYGASTGALNWYGMTATGTLGQSLAKLTIGTHWTSIVSADLDGDGTDEIGFYRASDGALVFYDIDATGHLGPSVFNITIGDGWNQVVTGHFNTAGTRGDQIAFYRGADGAFAVYGLTTAGLTPAQSIITLGTGWSSVFVGDFDGDGDDELGFYRASTGNVAIYEAGATGTLGTLLSGYTVGTGWTNVFTTDLNGGPRGDGVAAHHQDEIAFYNATAGSLVFYAASVLGQLVDNINAVDLVP